MHEHSPRSGRFNVWLAGLAFGLALLTFGLAYWAWYDQATAFHAAGLRAHENAAFMALRAFDFDEAYENPERILSDWRLVTARWTGMAVFTGALIAAGLALFQSQIAALRAALIKDHVLIIGDHEMALALVDQALVQRLPILHVSTAVTRTAQSGSLITVPRLAGEDPLKAGSVARAAKVVIAETDLGASAEGALRAHERLGSGPRIRASLAVHLDDPGTAEYIHHAPGGDHLFAFSEAQAAAREVMARHPPYLLARRIGAARAHILIVGFGRLGKALARDHVLNNLTSDLDAPSITVIDPRVEHVHGDFLHRHPEFGDACHFQIFGSLADAVAAGAIGGDATPVCSAYVCLHESARALSVAIPLRERASRDSLIAGPIFVRLRSGGLMRPDGGVDHLEPVRLYSFGSLDAAARSSRVLDPDPDAAARTIHEAYAQLGGYSAAPWGTLSEELRVSNRRVLTHLPAKLASLGFDLEPWLSEPRTALLPAIAPTEAIFRDEADRRALAELEHRRWMVDRRMNGWRFGPNRDNRRKFHPDLVPFDDLPDDIQAYDYAIVDWLNDNLPRAEAGLKRA